MGIRKILFFMVILFLFISANPLFASVKEDTVHLSFKKTALSNEKSSEYTVKKKDHLLGIIQKKYGGSTKENLNILKEVERLNPTIKDVNLIYPGQRVTLPGTVAEEEASETKEEETTTSTYVVKGGDSIVKIVSSELGLTLAEGYKMLGAVKLLNPGISDLNRIYPGQKIIIPSKGKLPEKAKEVPPQTKMAKAKYLSSENQLSILKYILGRTEGSIIAEGNFYIPLSPQGQIGVDCSQVPVAELSNGKTVLMDFSNRIPKNVKKIIESTWRNYSIISGTSDGEQKSVLEKLLDASDMYTLRRKGNYVTLGNANLLRIFIDWIVRWEGGDVPSSFCINFVDVESAATPGNVRSYAMKNGYDLMEVSEDSLVVDFEMPYQPVSVSSLDTGSKRELAESLLSTLGYSVSRDVVVQIFTIENDGFNLSVKADLMVEVEKGAMIFNFERLPAQFTDILMDKGTSVSYLSEEEGKRKTIERVLHATGRTFGFDTYKFPFSEKGGRTMGDISFPALKIENGDNTLYLIDYEMDSDIYGLLYGKWEVKLLNY